MLGTSPGWLGRDDSRVGAGLGLSLNWLSRARICSVRTTVRTGALARIGRQCTSRILASTLDIRTESLPLIAHRIVLGHPVRPLPRVGADSFRVCVEDG